jgi:hypothetical protein
LTIALLIAQCVCLSALPDPNWRAVIGFAAGASLFVATKDRALPSWLGMTAAARYHEEHDQKRRAQQIDRIRNITSHLMHVQRKTREACWISADVRLTRLPT